MAALFRRKDSVEAQVDDGATAEAASDPAADAAQEATYSRANGPWDITEFDDHITRLDLGGMLMPGVEGMQLQMQTEAEDGPIVAVTAILGESALQVQPFAAPRSGGYWDTVRAEIIENLGTRGEAREVEGAFGIELHAIVPALDENGREVAQPARFLGVDGPRWFLRAVVLGRAAVQPEAGAELEDVFREIVVRRGDAAMAPGSPIALSLPDQAPPGVSELDAPANPRGDLNPFERGPEITEIR